MNDNLKGKKVGFLHTTPSTIGLVEKNMKTFMPDVSLAHIYDSRVRFENFEAPRGVTPKRNLLRWANFASQLEQEGCNVIVSCCSLMPRATAFAQAVVNVPFIQLDKIILKEAVENYQRIGVITTTDYTIPYIKEGLGEIAADLNKDIELVFDGNNEALNFFYAGEIEKHDQIVLDSVKDLIRREVDCVLMGQIPLALLEDRLMGISTRIPILFAGKRSYECIRELLDPGSV